MVSQVDGEARGQVPTLAIMHKLGRMTVPSREMIESGI